MGDSLYHDTKEKELELLSLPIFTPSDLDGAMREALRNHASCPLLDNIMHAEDPEGVLVEKIQEAEAGRSMNGDERDLREIFGAGSYKQWYSEARELGELLKNARAFWRCDIKKEVDERCHYNWHYY